MVIYWIFEMSVMVQVFYDPHELMASLVDARSLTYKTPEIDDAKIL
jgi:hypothetical protein